MEATDPARRVGPCMTEASNSTTPSSFVNPPYPTLLSSGSNSLMFTPAIAASSVSAPDLRSSIAFEQARAPFELETTMLFAPDCALEASPAEDNAAVLNIQSLRVMCTPPTRFEIVRQFARIVLSSAILHPDSMKVPAKLCGAAPPSRNPTPRSGLAGSGDPARSGRTALHRRSALPLVLVFGMGMAYGIEDGAWPAY